MNKRQKLVQEQFLDNEEKLLNKLKNRYSHSLKDIKKTVKELQNQINELDVLIKLATDEKDKETLLSMHQSKVYQKQYQEALKKQISSILDNLQVEEFKSIDEYLKKCYEDGFIGTMYDLQGQGIPLCFPVDQEAVIRAVQLDSKISEGLYKHLGENVAELKKKISSEVSRGISNGVTFEQIAQQIGFRMMGTYDNPGGALAYAMRIARTEGHRIQVQSGMDACYKAKDAGADVVKQWDSTLDGKTRKAHKKVDGEIRELDEPFSNGLMFPGDPDGATKEVINCRCALLQRAKWALDDDELKTLKERAKFYGLDKSKNFDDFKKKYLSATDGMMQSGGRFGETTLERYIRRSENATAYYDKVRQTNDDIDKVAKASGMSKASVETIKNHIFFDKHIKYDGTVSTFDADYEMAVAWKRLSEGKPEERDLLLLKHELLENKYEKEYNITAEKAHKMANEKFNWEKAIFEMFGEEGEADDLL